MSVALAVKGLAVLTAIPVVILALWADYFGRGIEKLAKEDPLFERAAEMSKARLAGLCATFFQLGIFMGTGAVRNQAPLAAYSMFFLAILAQSFIQASIERKLRKPEQLYNALVRKH